MNEKNLFLDSFNTMGNKGSSKGKKDPYILTDEDLRILKTNTQYNEEEIHAWHSGFLKDCPSGKLDKKQFLNVYRVCMEFILDQVSLFYYT
jgi:Ca2+-binding EF-hand superfamily protein